MSPAEGTGALPLEGVDLAVASGLVALAGLSSALFRLGMEGRLAVAAIRTVLQLLAVGYVLEWVFERQGPMEMAAVVAVMVLFSGRAAVTRSSRKFVGVHLITFVTLATTGLLTTVTVTGLIVGVDPWYRPQYLIPLLGMVLGNGLTGISLTLDQLLEALDERRDLIESELALGASAWEAAREPLRTAVRRGMIPIINAMTVVGIVSLPGMMTGQILAGASPVDAVRYQIVVMFMLAAATTLGCVGMALLVYRRLFNERHQLRAERIVRRS